MFESWQHEGVAENRASRGERVFLRRGAASPGDPAKHCWVVDPRWPGRHAGLLLGWERTPDGWRGRVALVPDREAELVVALVSAVYLENAGPDGPSRHLQ